VSSRKKVGFEEELPSSGSSPSSFTSRGTVAQGEAHGGEVDRTGCAASSTSPWRDGLPRAWQRAELAAVSVNGTRSILESELEAISRELEDHFSSELLGTSFELIE
jgi:hypothetical protein